MRGRYIYSLDIDKDRVICASAFIDSEDRISSFFMEKSESLGIERGKVMDINLLAKSIKDCADRLQKKIGKKIEKFYVNISNIDTNLKSACGMILLREGRDVERLIQNTCSLNLNEDERLLHRIIKRFILDEEIISKDPEKLYGQNLGVELSLITLPITDIENILEAIHNARFEVIDFVFSGLSIALAVMPEDKENFILIDMKRDLTQMLYFEDKILRVLNIFDFGSEDLTKDLAKSLDLPLSLAEELRESYGSLEKSEDEDKQILVKTNYSYKPMKRQRISEVLYTSVNSMLNSLRRTIPNDFSSEPLIVITGDIIFLEEFLEFAESVFKLPVVMGRVKDFLTFQDSILSVGNFGLSIYALKKNQKPVQNLPSNLILRFLGKLKNIYQDYF